MTVDALLLAALFVGGGDAKLTTDKLKQKDELLAALYELERRVRAGELPTDAELALGRVSREQVLRDLDFRKAKHLGLDPMKLRDRLVPGFSAELDQLAKHQELRDVAPSEEPSPLLTLVLDVEEQLFAAADRRRQRAGLKSPLDAGPLSRPMVAPVTAAAPGDETPATPKDATAKTAAAAPKSADPRALGKAFYRAGRWTEALKAWDALRFDDPTLPLDLVYMHADCLLRAGRTKEAIKEWERLAADHGDTSVGQQSDFALKVARTLVAVQGVRDDEKEPKAAPAKGKGGTDAKPDAKPDPAPDAGKAKKEKGESKSHGSGQP